MAISSYTGGNNICISGNIKMYKLWGSNKSCCFETLKHESFI